MGNIFQLKCSGNDDFDSDAAILIKTIVDETVYLLILLFLFVRVSILDLPLMSRSWLQSMQEVSWPWRGTMQSVSG